MAGEARTVDNWNMDPERDEISPTSFQVLGCESKELANRWMKKSLPISPRPSFRTH